MKTFVATFLSLVFLLGPARAQWAGVLVGSRTIGGSAPDFVGEVDRFGVASTVATPVTLTSGVAAGNRIVIATLTGAGAKPLSVSDSKGNTYSIDQAAGADGTATQAVGICSANISTPLLSGDIVTIVWDDAGFQVKCGVLVQLSGCASGGQPDTATGQTAFSQAVSISASTTVAATLAIGILSAGVADQTYGSSAWTISGAVVDTGSRRAYVVYKQVSSPAAQDPSGTWNAGAIGQANAWVAYK